MIELDGIPCRRIVNGGPGVGVEMRWDIDVEVIDGKWKIDKKEDDREEEELEEATGT